MYRGHQGVHELFRDRDSTFPDLHGDVSEVRDLGEHVLAIGRIRGRGKASGLATESDIVWLVEFKNGKAIRIREYLDPSEALEAAGLSE